MTTSTSSPRFSQDASENQRSMNAVSSFTDSMKLRRLVFLAPSSWIRVFPNTRARSVMKTLKYERPYLPFLQMTSTPSIHMADTEFRPPEPTFVKPLDTASRRFSRISSAAASTRSWVLMNQQDPPPPPVEPIPLPEPVTALTPVSTAPRPLPEPPRRIVVLDSSDGEHMEVPTPGEAEAALGYQWTTGRGAKAREKGFVGGFVSGLRRLPRALVRTRRARRGTLGTEQTDGEGTEGTAMTGNTLPRYVSNPSTPVVGDANVRFLRPGGVDAQDQGPSADDSRRPRHPSFRLDPPAEDVQQQQVVTPVILHPDDTRDEGEGMPGDFPQGLPDTPYEPPLDNPYDRVVTPIHHPISPPALSPHPSRADDRLAAPLDDDEPVSVHAHPQPADDYRRMGAADAAHGQARSGTTISSGSFSTESPSFSNELSGFHRFFNALHLMPWVATDRITVDYQPKSKPRTAVSWYQPAPPADAPLDRERAPPAGEDDHRRHRHHRTHHRETMPESASPATPPAAYGIPVTYAPYPAFSPPHQPLPPGSNRRPSSPRRRPSPRPRTQSHRTHTRHHHRRSGAYHAHAPTPSQWIAPSVPQTLLPAPPAPVYVIQASPQSTAFTGSPPPPGQDGSGAGTAGSGTGSKRTSNAGSGSPQLLAPVYMQMQVMPGTGTRMGGHGQAHGERSVAFFPGSPGLAYAYPHTYAAVYPSPASPPDHGHG